LAESRGQDAKVLRDPVQNKMAVVSETIQVEDSPGSNPKMVELSSDIPPKEEHQRYNKLNLDRPAHPAAAVEGD